MNHLLSGSRDTESIKRNEALERRIMDLYYTEIITVVSVERRLS